MNARIPSSQEAETMEDCSANRFSLLSPVNTTGQGTSRRPGARIFHGLVIGGTLITVGVLTLIVGDILIKGIPSLSPSLFAFEYNSDNVSLLPALINTILITAIALFLSVIVGVFSAIYLVEYTGRGNRLVDLISLAAETLSGIPSIVYGLFGMLFFVLFLGWGMSLIAGACTMAIMTLPLIMRTTQEALKAVPDSYREGSFGLGAGQLTTVWKVILPSAIPGIFADVILSIGRIVGETAALIYTAGTVAEVPGSLFEPARTLSVHMYVLASEGLHVDATYATGVVLLLMVLLINGVSAHIAKKMNKGDAK